MANFNVLIAVDFGEDVVRLLSGREGQRRQTLFVPTVKPAILGRKSSLWLTNDGGSRAGMSHTGRALHVAKHRWNGGWADSISYLTIKGPVISSPITPLIRSSLEDLFACFHSSSLETGGDDQLSSVPWHLNEGREPYFLYIARSCLDLSVWSTP
ncbi:hypothetical protein TEQG_01538 [Trichophyton equinum CBS 127.97]|uniref:Uncharacterized protein n=1 Tax=Trichophyton equinum (strain ATCC MYA-4606 / CBS 127.97) TaxID=559882 RepID=F2PKT5_TRIEC|nr:hypothetical protein TEQG_01538 [Trichophyton equinum CBS 127.97]